MPKSPFRHDVTPFGPFSPQLTIFRLFCKNYKNYVINITGSKGGGDNISPLRYFSITFVLGNFFNNILFSKTVDGLKYPQNLKPKTLWIFYIWSLKKL